MEAMATGLPVICGDQGGYREYIEHGRNGFLFGDNEEAIGLALELQKNPTLRDQIGRCAFECVHERYSEKRIDTQLEFYIRRPSQ